MAVIHPRRYMRHSVHNHPRFRWVPALLLFTLLVTLSIVAKGSLDILEFLAAFGNSFVSVITAFVICLIGGTLIGMLAVLTPWLEKLLLPIIDLAQSFPTFALVPLLVVRFGHSRVAVIAILVIQMIWPMVFSVIGGMKNRRQDENEAANLFGAKGWRHAVFYLWPQLRPQIITGSVISWGEAWDTIVGAEIIAGISGAGSYLGNISSHGNIGLLSLGIVVYLYLIFIINQLFWLPLLHRYTKHTVES